MKGSNFIGTISLATIAVVCLGNIYIGCQPKVRLPNVVFILADDLGWSELGCYDNAFNETPNLDKLAGQGMRFTNAYATAPVCSPYRAALMTGQYPARIGITDYLRPDTDWHLPDEIDALAEIFKKADYTTGMTGKWHLSGYDKNGVKSGPGKHGFDEVMISEQTGIGAGSYFHPYTCVNEKINPVINDKEYLTDRLNYEAVEFIKRNKDRPFFLYVSHYAIHTTLASKEKDLEHFSKKEGFTKPLTRGYFKGDPRGQKGNPQIASMLRTIDNGLGMIMKSLDELGLAENTIVIFTSDNGGEHWVTDNAPLRSGKSSLYEGGIREPLIIKWPGVTESGSTCDIPTVNVDFYPTLAEITGQHKPLSHRIDGFSIVPLLKGEKIADRPLYWHYPLQKPHFLGGKSSGAIRKGDWKLIERFDNQTLELYNLAVDPGEKKNLSIQQPEKVRDLHTLLTEWRKNVSAKLPEGQNYAEP
jgi:arylsulfatase A-like enzyme